MKKLSFVIFISIFVISSANIIHAATWYVNGDASSSGSGTTWGTAFKTIQEAIYNGSTEDGDEIWVREGTYSVGGLAISVSKAVDIYGGFAGGETLFSERDWASNVTIVDGQNTNRCFTISDDATIDGFTIINGLDNVVGAGIYINSTSATVTNCYIKGNEVTGTTNNGLGGGIYCYNNASTPAYITNCLFAGNTASGESGFGGAAYVGLNGSVFITNCTFSGNAAGNSGGAIFLYSSASATITNCILWGNSATTGNEIYDLSGETVTYCNIDQDGYEGSTGNIRQNPKFNDLSDTDPANWDLHLRFTSPCIDAGTNSAPAIPSTDIDGNSRTSAAGCDSTAVVDMGADEFNVICHCVASATTLNNALTTAETNGDNDIIRVVQGYYNNVFSYSSSEGKALILRGGYTSGCSTRVMDPSTTILDADDGNNVLELYDSAGGDFLVDGLTFKDGGGISAPNGAGIYLKSYILTGQAGMVKVANNIVTSNTATGDGAGIYALSQSSSGPAGDVILTNNLVYDNDTTSAYGGGVYAESKSGESTGGSVILTNNTITENSSQHGGGAWLALDGSGGTIYACNNIIRGNTASVTGDDIYLDKDTGEANSYNNNYSDRGGDTWNSESDWINVDPLFVGGGDYHLKPGSDCVNAGLNTAPEIPEYDFEGDPRIFKGAVDIGWDEFISSVLSHYLLLLLN